MVLRTVLVLIFLIVLLVADLLYPGNHQRNINFDLAYIAENCRLSDAQESDIKNFVEIMDVIIGHDYYLFEREADGTQTGTILAASRDLHEELLCLPVVGCIISPHLKRGCVQQ